MAATVELSALLEGMSPTLSPEPYVYARVDGDAPAELEPVVTVREVEGTTVVITRAMADEHGLAYEYVAAWITLNVHSSLHAVGLTAAVSRVLTESGISANVVAGYYHDHIFVPQDRADAAMECLRALSRSS